MPSESLARTTQKIDQINSQDPNQELVNTIPQPHELVYSKRLTDWVLKLEPDASEVLRIAARGQHIARWMIPRERYEKTRVGYLLWREDLKKFHAEKVSGIMREVGYPEDSIQKVSSIILKKNLRSNPDAQALEDALCLLFLETQFDNLKEKTLDDKMKEIVRKTWKKMSTRAQKLALSLPLKQSSRQFLKEALQAI